MSMAPDIQTVYEFEDQIEPAVAAFLNSLTGATVEIQQGSDNLQTPFFEVQLVMGQDKEHYQPVVRTDTTPDLRNDLWDASLRVTLVTNRQLNQSQHRKLRGQARASLYNFNNWQASALPYHELKWIKSASSTPTVQEGENFDVSQMTFDILIGIRPGAWPLIPTP